MSELTYNDVNEYITMLRLHYPDSFVLSKNPTQAKADMTTYMKCMYQDLHQYPKELCDVAMSNLRKNYKYSKVGVANIIEEIKKLQFAYQKSEPELWAEFTAVRGKCVNLVETLMQVNKNGSMAEYELALANLNKFFKGLSIELQRYFQNWGEMYEIAKLDGNSLRFEKQTFFKIVREQNERALIKQDNPELTKSIEQGNNNLKLLGE